MNLTHRKKRFDRLSRCYLGYCRAHCSRGGQWRQRRSYMTVNSPSYKKLLVSDTYNAPSQKIPTRFHFL